MSLETALNVINALNLSEKEKAELASSLSGLKKLTKKQRDYLKLKDKVRAAIHKEGLRIQERRSKGERI